MQFEFTEEQRLIASTIEGFARAEGSSERVRRAMASELGYDPAVWQTMAKELGLCGMMVPESCGGQGLTMVEIALVFEQLGKVLLPSPLLSTAVLGVGVLNELEEQASDWLRQIAGGQVRCALAVCSRGRAEYVLDACSADLLLVADFDNDRLYGVGTDEPGKFAGITTRPVHLMDQTRRMAHLTLDVAALPASALLSEGEQVPAVINKGLDLARIALGAEAAGAAQTCLLRTVEYARERVQFGRAIGSFQAVKHQLADMMVASEAAISAIYLAACTVSEEAAQRRSMSALAKVQASEALSFCAARMIQLHGGIGFTWEHDAHLYFKRARSTATMFGSNTELDEIIASDIGLEKACA